MNKTAIKNFAVWARNKLIADITYRAGLIGVSDKGIAQPLPQSSKDLQFFDIGTKDYAQVSGKEVDQRKALVKAIQDKEHDSDYATAFKAVIEEVAYTWFNRLIAIRFMEVNDYLPSRVRVLSSENQAKNEPDFVTTPFDTDMEFTSDEQDAIMQLKDENKLDDLFRMLFIKQCNKLHEILPELFENTNDYTELLLSISFTDSDGVVCHLVHDIDEDDFNIEKEGQVEIIGWMYQYYNIEPKDETFALLKKNVKITKERIPAATQLFTPDWIVRYMVENSLGRLWVEGHPNEDLKSNWKYYLEEAVQETDVQAQLEKICTEYRNLNPEDIKVIDPCMGSGHILVYCFDVLMQIYESQGYTQRDAVQSILENNLFGLDIDKRAAQLSYFAVMIKARQYDRRIFGRKIKPHVYIVEESNDIDRAQLNYFGAELSPTAKSSALNELNGLLDTLVDAKEYGSILNLDNYDWDLLRRFVVGVDDRGQMTLDTIGIDETKGRLRQLIEIGHVMAQKYDVVVTNPPYMGTSGMSARLNKFVKERYPDSKSDLFAVFIEKCGQMTRKNGYQAMITQHAWMFLSSFEKLRTKSLKKDTVNMAHLGARAFEEIGGEVVQTTSFVLRNTHIKSCKGVYCRLIESTTQQGKEDMFLSGENRYESEQDNFSKIPGSPIAYWLSNSVFKIFAERQYSIGTYSFGEGKNVTTNNAKFILFFWEVNNKEVGAFDYKWLPCAMGGDYRKWYGNIVNVIDWSKEARIFYKKNQAGRIIREEFWGMPGVTWGKISSASPSFRLLCEGQMYQETAVLQKRIEDSMLILTILNTKVSRFFLSFLAPTLNFQLQDICAIPLLQKLDEIDEQVQYLGEQCVSVSRSDWDSFEISWDFKQHPLIMIKQGASYYKDMSKWENTISSSFEIWKDICDGRFNQLKANEEELNRIFINIYGLQDELIPEIDDKDVTIRKADLQRDIKSLLSYAVGCMFGRYSLDADGLAYAGGEWDYSKYSTFIPDKDNCIPVTDEPYFEDDIAGRFFEFIKVIYGADTLEENLDFIAKALDNKGSTSREVIRNYFLTDFIKDHIKTYQKRPIYWLFDSGKQNGFKALVYMHRWNSDTVGNLRVEYLHKTQRIYEREIQRMQETVDNSQDPREINKASKRKEKLQKQLKETKDYDTMLAHIALSRVDIDLDDGVKVNYEKIQTGRDGKKMQILAKI